MPMMAAQRGAIFARGLVAGGTSVPLPGIAGCISFTGFMRVEPTNYKEKQVLVAYYILIYPLEQYKISGFVAYSLQFVHKYIFL